MSSPDLIVSTFEKNGRSHEPEAIQSYEPLSSMMIPTCFIHSAPKQWLPS